MKKVSLVHPFLFGLLPPLILYSVNIKQIAFIDTWRAFAAVLLFTYILFISFGLVMRNVYRGALLTTATLFIFFSYYHILNYIPQFQIIIADNFPIIGKHKLIFSIVLIVYLYFTFRLFKSKSSFITFSQFLSLALAFILVMNAVGVVEKTLHLKKLVITPATFSISSQVASTQLQPDIYYIILDGYGRADAIKQYFDFDNKEFLGFLESQGFYVASESSTNYAHTYLSLASSLNMDYLDNLVPNINMDFQSPTLLRELIAENLVVKTLKNLGYTFITFSSGYTPTDHLQSADIYYYQILGINNFEYRLLNNTLIRRLGIFLKLDFYQLSRERFIFNFSELPKIANIPEPTFTFLHVLSPHPPFIFGENGESVGQGKPFTLGDGSSFKGTKDEYKSGYINQLKFLNKSVQQVVRAILRDSKSTPIIILQSDHGSGLHLDWNSISNSNMHERMSNFIAIYAPTYVKQKLYPTITPVNIFRVIFNEEFGDRYELLVDKSYFSLPEKPFMFYQVVGKELIR